MKELKLIPPTDPRVQTAIAPFTDDMLKEHDFKDRKELTEAMFFCMNKFHILKYLSKDIEFTDVADKLACFGVFGPKSRGLMSKLSKDDFSRNWIQKVWGKYLEKIVVVVE